MTRSLPGILCLFVTVAFAQAPAAQGGASQPADSRLCRLEGKLVNSLTGEPIRRGNLSLSPNAQVAPFNAAQRMTAQSDAEGVFVFENIEPGTYQLMAERTGFVRQAYSARSNPFSGTPITLAPGQRLKGLEFKLTPQTAITGTVIDEEGEPIPEVMVFATNRFGVMTGPGFGRTNDRGEFRLANLNPGTYSVLARPMRRPETDSTETYVWTYYPGVTDPGQAVSIEVAAGRDTTGIVIPMQKARVYRISGKIIGTDNPSPQLQVALVPRRRAGASAGRQTFGGLAKPDGTFELRAIPGEYDLAVFRSFDQRPVQLAGIPINLGMEDLENVVVSCQQPVVLTGSIRVDGESDANFQQIELSLRPAGNSFVPPASIDKDGSFKFDGVSRDLMYFMFRGMPRGHYARAVMFGSQDVLDSGLDLTSAGESVSVEIILSPKAAAISGAITDGEKPIPGVHAYLKPEPLTDNNIHRYVQATTDQNGQFSMENIIPGEYKIFAAEEPVPSPRIDSDALKAFLSGAKSISIRESAREVIELKLPKP
ncbi:MAG: collagen binding domain-containing protein [Bryobacteraceae bacterium]